MFKKLNYFILILSLVLFFCKKEDNIKNNVEIQPLEQRYIFQDKDQILKIEIDTNFNYHEIFHENEKYYIFEWYDNGNQKDEKTLLKRLEIKFFKENSLFYNNILNPNYENFFKNICNCNLTQKGWISHKGKNLRIFHYKYEDLAGISMQWNEKNFLIDITVLSKNLEILNNEKKNILEHLTIL